jgi:hypothetical protein
MEPEERAGKAGRGGDDLLHLLADDGLDVGACLVVVAFHQLSRRRRRAAAEKQEQCYTGLDRHGYREVLKKYWQEQRNVLLRNILGWDEHVLATTTAIYRGVLGYVLA